VENLKYEHCRVSTLGQDLEVQIERLLAEGCDMIIEERFILGFEKAMNL
jgi:hypothetical protein